MNALENEGKSFAGLLVNIGEWTAWHSSGEMLSQTTRDGTNVSYHLVDLDAENIVYSPDALEAKTLEAFYAGDTASVSLVDETDGVRVFHYIEPVLIREYCLECHASYRVGEPRGAISIEIPMAPTEARLASGRVLYAAFSAATLLGMLGIGAFFLRMFQVDMNAANVRLEEMAVTDSLTGAANRRAVLARFEDEFERSRRTNEPLSVILLDIDHFKDINDALGHAAGDSVLVEFTHRAVGSLRTYDMFGRIGGEEFLVVAPGTAPQTAQRLAERLLEALRGSPVSTASGSTFVTASAGAATISEEDAGVDAMLARADDALYRAKETGRDRFVAAD